MPMDRSAPITRTLILFVTIIAIGLSLWAGLDATWVLTVAAIVFIGIAVLLRGRYEYVVIFLIGYLPLEPFVLKFLTGTPFLVIKYSLDAIILLLTLIAFAKKLMARRSLESGGIGSGLFFMGLAWIVSGYMNQTSAIVSFSALRLISRFLVLYLAVINLDLSKEFVKKAVIMLLASGLLQVGVAFAEYLAPETIQSFFKPPETIDLLGGVIPISGMHEIGGRGRLFGTMGRYDALGFFISMLFCVSLAHYVECPHTDKRRVRCYALLSGLFLITVVFTFSRMSIGTCFIASVLTPLFAKRKQWILLWSGTVIFCIVLITVLNGLPDLGVGENASYATPIDRLMVVFNPDYAASQKYGRAFILVDGFLEVLRVSPIYGLGPGMIGSSSGQFFGMTNAANILNIQKETFDVWGDVGWVTYLGQYGLAGLLGLFLIYYKLLRIDVLNYRRATGWGAKALYGAYLSFFISFVALWHIFSNPLEARILSFFFWIFTALIIIVSRETSTENGEKVESV